MKKVKINISFWLLIAVLLLFNKFLLLLNYLLALFLHELAHLFVATKLGYTLKSFNINMFGFSVDIEEKVEEKDIFIVNIAGPVFNLFLCIVCMAIYWLFPKSFNILNEFFLSNFCLAIFNLLPIHPLDGGKIFSGMVKNKKIYKKLDFIIRVIFSIFFFWLFLISIKKQVNVFFLVLSVFFLITKANNRTTFSLFKQKKKGVEKSVVLKVNKQDSLLTLLKKIKSSHFTIFYCPELNNKFLDENELIYLASTKNLNSQLQDVL